MIIMHVHVNTSLLLIKLQIYMSPVCVYNNILHRDDWNKIIANNLYVHMYM